MATYSKYTGTLYESVGSTLLLANPASQSYQFSENKVFTDLLDNTEKLIYPDRLRNAILSLYDSIPLKETTVTGGTYIGIDLNDQNLKKTMYIGNRTFKSTELMDISLLSDSDVIINGTGADNSPYNDTTKVVFLAGTNPSLFSTAPRIETRLVTNNDSTKRMDLTFFNPAGNVEILSKRPGAKDPGYNVLLNNLNFPPIQVSAASASNDKTLSKEGQAFVWSETVPFDPGFYGASATTVPIFGSSSLVNGYPLEFTDTRWCPIEIGGVALGQAFDKRPLIDVLESIIYDYVPPKCTLELSDPTQKYLEIGTNPVINLKYSVTKKTQNTKPVGLKNMTPNQLPAIVSDVSQSVSGVSKGIVILPLERKTTVFEVVVSDGTQTTSASASVTGIYPFFYGLTSSSALNTLALSQINKLVSEKKSIGVDVFRSDITNSDNLFFAYDSEYGPLLDILITDGFGNVNSRISNFTSSQYALSSPSGLWASKSFYVYKMVSFRSTYINQTTASVFIRLVF